jgi:hypothetical protein
MLHSYMFRSYDHHQVENILLSRTTQLATDPLFYTISNITVIVYYILLRIVDMLLLWATFSLRCVDIVENNGSVVN